MIKTILPQSRYLVYYGELFSVLSWQVFKGHFQIIIFSVCLSRAATLLCGLVCLCWVSCNLETEMSVIDWISALIISGTICVRKSKLLRYPQIPSQMLVLCTFYMGIHLISQNNVIKLIINFGKLLEVNVRVGIYILLHAFIL